MVKAWFMDDDQNDPTLEHHLNPPKDISLPDLFDSTGVEYFYIDPENTNKLDAIRKDRGYTYEDEVTCSKECLPNFEEKLKSFFQEHLHTEEEIRFIIDGTGYFDVRNDNDQWIRILVERGDLIIIPSGIYHRFTLDTKRFIRTKRYFIGKPVWMPYNRPADEMECRQDYLMKLQNNKFTHKSY